MKLLEDLILRLKGNGYFSDQYIIHINKNVAF